MIGLKFSEFQGQVTFKESVKNGEMMRVTTIVKNKPVKVDLTVNPSNLLEDENIILEPLLVLDLPKEKYPSVPKVKVEPLEASYMIKETFARLEFKVNCLTRDQQNVLFRLQVSIVKKEEDEKRVLSKVYSSPIKVISKPPKKTAAVKKEEKPAGVKRKRSEMEEEAPPTQQEENKEEVLQKMYSEVMGNSHLLMSLQSSIMQLKEAVMMQTKSGSSHPSNNIVVPICFPMHTQTPTALPVEEKKRKFFRVENDELDSLLDGLELDDKKDFFSVSEAKKESGEALGDSPPTKKRLTDTPLEEHFNKFSNALSTSVSEGVSSEKVAEKLQRELSLFPNHKKNQILDCLRKLVEKEEEPQQSQEPYTPTLTHSFLKSTDFNSNDFVDSFFN